MDFTPAGLVADSTFKTGADDRGEAGDYYNDAPGLRNNIDRAVSSFMSGFLGRIGLNSKSLINTVKTIASGSFKNGSLTDKLDGLMRANGTSLSALTSSTQKQLLGQMGMDPKLVNSFTADIGGTIRRIQNADFHSVSGMLEMVSSISKGTVFGQLVNQSAEVAMISGLIAEASKYRLGEVTDILLKEVKDPSTRYGVYASVGKNFQPDGSIDSLVSMVDAHPEMASSLLSRNPSLPSTVLSTYRFERGLTPDQYPDKLAKIERFLNATFPTWLTVDRNGKQVYNLNVFSTLSTDARTLFLSSDKYIVPVTAAKAIKSKDKTVLFKEHYPYMPLRF